MSITAFPVLARILADQKLTANQAGPRRNRMRGAVNWGYTLIIIAVAVVGKIGAPSLAPG